MRIEDVLDLVNKEKRINERAAAARKIGATVLIAAGVGVGVTGIVFAVKVKRKIWLDLKRKSTNAMDAVRDMVRKRACGSQKPENITDPIQSQADSDSAEDFPEFHETVCSAEFSQGCIDS